LKENHFNNVNKIISLRKWELSDAPLLAEIANNPSIAANMRDAFPSPYTLNDALAFITKTLEQEHFKHVFAILYNNIPVGSVGLFKESDIYQYNYELGYWLGEAYWGKGIMQTSVEKIIDYGFMETDAHRLFAGVFEHNVASARVLEKNGFRLVGVAQNKVYKQGHFLNECLYELLKVV
jgi:ribosomal-protein-alanine N-acetyltransferase